MSNAYHVTVVSLPEYDELVAEIYVDHVFIGLLSQEGGPDRTLFELASQSEEPIRVQVATFEKALAEAKQRLWDLRRRQ